MADHLNGIQFPDLPEIPKTNYSPNVGEISRGADVSGRNRFNRVGSPYTNRMAASMAMRPSTWNGNTFHDDESMMHPLSTQPNTLQQSTF